MRGDTIKIETLQGEPLGSYFAQVELFMGRTSPMIFNSPSSLDDTYEIVEFDPERGQIVVRRK